MAYQKRNRKKCGDFGGLTYDKQPCPRYAGWGVRPKVRVGPCKDHTEEAKTKRRFKQEEFVKMYVGNPSMTMQQVCDEIDISHDTLHNWREAEPEFNETMKTAIDYVDEWRYVAVESAAFNQIIAGEASASLVKFWLVNRAPKRWKDKVTQELVGKDGEELVSLGFIRSVLEDHDPATALSVTSSSGSPTRFSTN